MSHKESKKKQSRSSAKPRLSDAKDLAPTVKFARERYGRGAAVMAVTLGTKFVAGEPTGQRTSVQFLVRKKLGKRRVGKNRLPKFLLWRDSGGRTDRSRRVPTDVIEVGDIEPACGAGSKIRHRTLKGTATLYFRNKAPSSNEHYLLTCAHNVGDLTARQPAHDTIKSPCEPAIVPFARTVISTVIENGRLTYDVALAEVEPGAVAHVRDLSIDRTPTGATVTHVSGLLPRSAILPGTPVNVAFGASRPRPATVESFAGEVPVTYRSGPAQVNNAFLLRTGVSGGDSGSLIYDDQGRGVGIVFARSTSGLGWFHPLEDALIFLSDMLGKRIAIV